MRQTVIANLGRVDELAASGALASLFASGAKLTDQVLLINALDEDAGGPSSGPSLNASAVRCCLVNLGAAGIQRCPLELLKDRSFEFAVERAVFVATLHCVSSSAKQYGC